MKVLMIEDEKHMAEAVQFILKKNNFNVTLAFDGEEGLDLALSDIYDAIILDIMLPKKDGISVLKEIRNNRMKTPVIMLTAKGEVNDKVIGLDMGADDYLAKPFQTEELIARLKAITRRGDDLKEDNVLKYGDVELNPNTLILKNEINTFKLTLKESQLLELLINKKEKIISKDIIIEYLWGYDADTIDNNVEVYISLLRKKLDNMKAQIKIKTIRGAGYIITKE